MTLRLFHPHHPRSSGRAPSRCGSPSCSHPATFTSASEPCLPRQKAPIERPLAERKAKARSRLQPEGIKVDARSKTPRRSLPRFLVLAERACIVTCSSRPSSRAVQSWPSTSLAAVSPHRSSKWRGMLAQRCRSVKHAHLTRLTLPRGRRLGCPEFVVLRVKLALRWSRLSFSDLNRQAWASPCSSTASSPRRRARSRWPSCTFLSPTACRSVWWRAQPSRRC